MAAWAHLLVSLVSIVMAAGVRGVDGQVPISSPRVNGVLNVGGASVPDPYAWLEDLDDEAVEEWARAQDAYTRYVTGSARRGTMIDSIVANHPARRGELDAPHERDGVWFHTKVMPDGVRRVLRSKGFGAADEVLPIDGSIARGPAGAMIWPDPTGHVLVAAVRETGGGGGLTLAIVDAGTGEAIVPRVGGITTQSRVHWLSDGSGFVYTARRVVEGTSPGALQILEYDLESITSRVVYEDPEASPGVRPWTVINQESDAVTFTDVGAPFPRLVRVSLTESAEPQVLLENSSKVYPVGESGGEVFVVSTEDAPRGEVLVVRVDRPEEIWTLIPEDASGSIQRGRFFGGRVVLDVYSAGRSEIRITDPDTRETRTVTLPYVGWMSRGMVGSPWSSTFAFMIEGVVDPGSTYAVDVEAGPARLHRSLEPNTRPSDYLSKIYYFESFDGVEVPLYLFHSRDSSPSSEAPVWLYAYGSGGFADAPWHQVQHRAFLDAGGVYAIVGVRGGGAGGTGWREAGEGLKKQVGISDYVSAAEWLIDQRMADPAAIIANGNSAGGPLVTSAALQHPGLFAALLVDFAFLDTVGGLAGGRGTSLQRRSFGNPDDPEQLEVMLRWSPYVLAQRPGCYPPTFVGQGDRDAMGVYHSYKFVAALQHAQQCENPVLLQVAWGFGHTLGRAPEQANQLAFLHQILHLDFGLHPNP